MTVPPAQCLQGEAQMSPTFPTNGVHPWYVLVPFFSRNLVLNA